MRRVIPLTLLALALAACGGAEQGSDPAPIPSAIAASPTDTPAATPEPTTTEDAATPTAAPSPSPTDEPAIDRRASGVLVATSEGGLLLADDGTTTPGFGPAAFRVAAADGLWVLTRDAVLHKFDRATGEEYRQLELEGEPRVLHPGTTLLWVALAESGLLLGVDALSENVLVDATIEPDPTAVAEVGTEVWVADEFQSVVQRIDATSGELLGTLEPGAGPRALASTGDGAWIALGTEGAVAWLPLPGGGDGAEPPPPRRVDVGGSPSRLALGDGRLHVIDEQAGRVITIDTTSGDITAEREVGIIAEDLVLWAGLLYVLVNAPGGTAELVALDPATLAVVDAEDLGVSATDLAMASQG